MSESPSGPSVPDASSESAASARDAEMQTRIAASPFELSQEPVTPEGEAATPPAGAVPAPAYEHLGELPTTYGTQSVYLVAYDPHQLFAYWDIDWASVGGAAATGYALHVCRADGEVESQVDISRADAGRYLAVTRPGGTYYVELGRRGRDGSWLPLAFSGRVTMPPAGLSGETEAKFATLPFHLSFQRLLELIHAAMGRGEELTTALARLQRGDQPATTASLLHTFDGLNGEQLHTLELLLGRKFNVSSATGAGGSENVILRDRREALSSGGAFGSESHLAAGAGGSETLSSSAFGSEALSSGAFGSESGAIHAPGAAGGSETLSSGLLAAGGAFGSESLSSGLLAVGGIGGSETLSSGGFGSETLSALVAGLSSETLASFGWNSEMFGAVGGGGSESLNSEAWRMASAGGSGADSAGMDSERAEMFRRALGSNLDVLGSLFSAVNSGLSSGFSPGSSSDLTSPGGR